MLERSIGNGVIASTETLICSGQRLLQVRRGRHDRRPLHLVIDEVFRRLAVEPYFKDGAVECGPHPSAKERMNQRPLCARPRAANRVNRVKPVPRLLKGICWQDHLASRPIPIEAHPIDLSAKGVQFGQARQH